MKTQVNYYDDQPVPTCSAITRKVNKLKHLREQLKQLQAVEKGLVGDIKDYLGEGEILLGTHGEELASYKHFTRYVLDTKELEANEPEIYAEYSTEREERRFLLK